MKRWCRGRFRRRISKVCWNDLKRMEIGAWKRLDRIARPRPDIRAHIEQHAERKLRDALEQRLLAILREFVGNVCRLLASAREKTIKG